ncbi:MAG: carboxymuconolactone decarboxylase family protein [Acidimicrobiales bacterium]
MSEPVDHTEHHAEGRVHRLDHDAALAAADRVELPPYMCDLSIFQVLLRHPPLAKAINDLLSQLLFRGALDDRLRELVIMRVGWQTGSVYEWAQHWRIAPRFGVSETDLLGVRDWLAHEPFGRPERAVLAATDEVLANGAIGAATWTECKACLGSTEALLELPAVIGTWRLISEILRSLAVPLEDDVSPWPPDGMSPG